MSPNKILLDIGLTLDMQQYFLGTVWLRTDTAISTTLSVSIGTSQPTMIFGTTIISNDCYERTPGANEEL